MLGTAAESVVCPSTLQVSGQITGSFGVHFFGSNTPTMYNTTLSTTFPSGTSVGSTYYYLKWPSPFTFNWTPSYTSNAVLGIPYNGLYAISFTLHVGNNPGSLELGIIKNNPNVSNNLNYPGNVLATGCLISSQPEVSISTTAYLTTTDNILVGFYAGLATYSPALIVQNRSSLSITLIQRTA
jgi:hypothetical protein